MNFFNKKPLYFKKNAGMTLIETVVYVAIFAFVFVFAVESLLTVFGLYNNFYALKTVKNEGETSLERILREVKLANDFDVSKSILNSSPGKIYLNTIDETNGTAKTIEFFKDGKSLAFKENGGAEKYLTSSSTEILSLVFRNIYSASTSKAVRIELEIAAKKGNTEKSEKFYTTGILRGSY